MQPGIYRCIFDRKNINIDSIINLIDTWWRTSIINNDFDIREFIIHFDNFIAHKYIDIQYIRKQIIIKSIEHFLNRNSCNIIDISDSKVKIYVNNTLLKLSPLYDDRNYFHKNYFQGIINKFKMQRCINMTYIHNTIRTMFIPGTVIDYCKMYHFNSDQLFIANVCALDILQDDKKHFRLLNKGIFSFDDKKYQGYFKTLDFINLNKSIEDSILEYSFYLDQSKSDPRNNIILAATIDHGEIIL